MCASSRRRCLRAASTISGASSGAPFSMQHMPAATCTHCHCVQRGVLSCKLYCECRSWLWPVFATSDAELVRTAGLDALMLCWTSSLGIQVS